MAAPSYALQADLQTALGRITALEKALASKADLVAGVVPLAQVPFAPPSEIEKLRAYFDGPPAPATPALAADNLLPPGAVAALALGVKAGVPQEVRLNLKAGPYNLSLLATNLVSGGVGVKLTTIGGAWVGKDAKLLTGSQVVTVVVPTTDDYKLVFDAGQNGGGVVSDPILTPAS